MHIEGYDPNGADTLGAQYAREHLDDLPDGVQVGAKVRLRLLTLVVGNRYRMDGLDVRLLAGKDHAGVTLDVREADAASVERQLPVGRLLLWMSYYWRVQAVNGVFITLALWGTKPRREGWRITCRNGYYLAEPFRTTKEERRDD